MESRTKSNNPWVGLLLHSGSVCRESFAIRFCKNGLENVCFKMRWHKIKIILKNLIRSLLNWKRNFTNAHGHTLAPINKSTRTVHTQHTVNTQSLKHIQVHRPMRGLRGGGGKWDQIQREITDWGQWIDGWLEAPWSPWVMVLHLIAFCVCLNYAT